MNLDDFELSGGCDTCYFYCTSSEYDGKKCTRRWFDDDSGDFELFTSCDEASESTC